MRWLLYRYLAAGFKILLFRTVRPLFLRPGLFSGCLRSSQTDDRAHRSAGIGRFLRKWPGLPAHEARRDPAAYGSSETQRRFHPPAPLDSRQPPGGAFSGKPYEPVHPILPEQQISEINRRITSYEYQKVVDAAIELGLTQGFMQEKSSAKEEYTPPFELQGI